MARDKQHAYTVTGMVPVSVHGKQGDFVRFYIEYVDNGLDEKTTDLLYERLGKALKDPDIGFVSVYDGGLEIYIGPEEK